MDFTDIKLGKEPFYAWQCLTLQLSNRDIYLVIKNEKMMSDMIKLLISSLNTIDGTKGSAEGIKQALYKKRFADIRKQINKPIEDWRKKQAMNQVDHELMRKVYLKFLLIRVRSKIGYESFIKRKTVLEVFFTTILESHHSLTHTGCIKAECRSKEL